MHRTGIAALVLLLSVPGLNYCAEKPAPEVLRDLYGDPLPPGALARMGSTRFKHKNGVCDAAFAPDGKTLASLGSDFTLYLWEVPSGRLIRRIDSTHERDFRAVFFSHDGKVLALQRGDESGREINLIELNSGKELGQLKIAGSAGSISGPLAFSRDGRCIALAQKDGIHISAVATAKEERILTEPDAASPKVAAYCPDGKTLVAVDRRSCVCVWDLASGKVIRRFTMDPAADKTADLGVWLSQDGSTVGSLTAGAFHIWDVATGKERLVVPQPMEITGCFFSCNGKRLVFQTRSANVVIVVDAITGKSLYEFNSELLYHAPAFSPDGRMMAIVEGAQGRLRLWDITSGKELGRDREHRSRVRSVTFSPSGKVLATVGDDLTLRVWNGSTGQQLQQFEQRWARRPAFTADGRAIIARSETDAITTREMETGKTLATAKFPRVVVGDLLTSPDGKSLLVETHTERPGRYTFQLSDLDSGKLLATSTYEWDGDYLDPGQMAFTPDSSLLAVADSTATTHLLDARGLKEIRQLQDESNIGWEKRSVHAIAFSPDGRLLATCSDGNYHGRVLAGNGDVPADTTINLLDVATEKVVRRLIGHTDVVLAVAFSPDGRTIATGGEDGTIRMWEVATGRELARFSDEGSRVHHIAFAPDGERLASAMNSGSAIVWDCKPTGWKKPQEKPTAAALDLLWKELRDSDGPAAHRAIYTLAAFPGASLPLLAEKLRPIVPIPPEKLRRLIRDLNDDEFERRDAAQKELITFAHLAEANLRQALAKTKSAEVRRAINNLLDGMPRGWDVGNSQTVQAVRGVWVLQRIGTPEARKQLEALAAGASSERLTCEAKDALAWLDRRARLSRQG